MSTNEQQDIQAAQTRTSPMDKIDDLARRQQSAATMQGQISIGKDEEMSPQERERRGLDKKADDTNPQRVMEELEKHRMKLAHDLANADKIIAMTKAKFATDKAEPVTLRTQIADQVAAMIREAEGRGAETLDAMQRNITSAMAESLGNIISYVDKRLASVHTAMDAERPGAACPSQGGSSPPPSPRQGGTTARVSSNETKATPVSHALRHLHKLYDFDSQLLYLAREFERSGGNPDGASISEGEYPDIPSPDTGYHNVYSVVAMRIGMSLERLAKVCNGQ